MAKIVRKKKKVKRTVNLLGVAVTMFFISSFLFLTSSLFLRSYNNSLTAQVQELQTKTAGLETQSEALKFEIQTLSTRERVDEMAANSGLSNQQENIITISNDTEGEAEE